MAELTVRPAPNGVSSSLNSIFNVYLAPEYMLRKKLHDRQICLVERNSIVIGSAVVEKSPESDIRPTIVQTSKAFQALHQLKLGDKVSLHPREGDMLQAMHVTVVQYLVNNKGDDSIVPTRGEDRAFSSSYLKRLFVKAQIISPKFRMEKLDAFEPSQGFKVLSINGSCDMQPYKVSEDTQVKIIDRDDKDDQIQTPLRVQRRGVCGIDEVCAQLNEILCDYCPQKSMFEFIDSDQGPEQGILLHGPFGTGKSTLLNAIAEAGWRGVVRLKEQDVLDAKASGTRPEAFIQRIFSHCERQQPCVLLIDDLDSIAPNTSSQASASASSLSLGPVLREEMSKAERSHIVVFGTAQAPSDIYQKLRNPHGFSTEIELPVPNTKVRGEILRELKGHPVNSHNADLDHIAGRTHGFVGADLFTLHRKAGNRAKARVRSSHINKGDEPESKIELRGERTKQDYLDALRHVRPTAMQGINVETPDVRWSDIGGQEEVKEYLEEAIVFPYKFSSEFREFRLRPTKGLLLYGPPGCSKTMIARAIATESGLQFIAVKGAELLNMYVGESERAIRDLFARARRVAPSIIFFDEIDAIGTSRFGGQQNGVQTVTTLLNELDGVDKSESIFVLAATNRPEVIDPALLRPGRLDQMIYVSPPDKDARLYIMRQHLRGIDRIAPNVNLEAIAEMSEGRSGAEMFSICQRAGLLALKDQIKLGDKQNIVQDHFLQALNKVPKNITPEMEQSYRAFAASK